MKHREVTVSGGSGLARRVAAAALLLAGIAATSLAAQTGPPKFFVERIEVVAERLSAEIVISESLLREGRDYTEDELRDAANRIQRLPFVLGADLSLAKGSERERYLLRIEVIEARRWFFSLDAGWELGDEQVRFDPALGNATGLTGSRSDGDTDALVGRRFAVGRRTLLFATVGGGDGLFALGLQRYDLFDRNVLLSVTLGADEGVISDGWFNDPIWRGQVRLGVPIRGDHAVRLSVDGSYWSADLLGDEDFRRETAEVELAWVYNSLDDPVMPRSGTVFDGGPLFGRTRQRMTLFDVEGRPVSRQVDEDRFGLRALARRWWPIGRAQSVSAGLRAYAADSSIGDTDFRELEAELGYQVFLLRRRGAADWRELRAEVELSGLSQRVPGVFGERFDIDSTRLRASLVFRHRWGLYRLFVDYVDRSDVR